MPATYEPIATTTVSSTANTIVFNSIPNTFSDIRLVLVGTGNTAGLNVFYRFNGDTASNYSSTHLWGDGTSGGSARATGQTYIYANYAGNLNTTIPTLWTMDLFSYAGSTNKSALLTSSQDLNGSGNVTRDVGLWRSTAAITSITIWVGSANLANGFTAGTTATLYGIKAA